MASVNNGPALVYEESGVVVPIPAEGLIVGRTPDCSMPVSDSTVSKQHAKLVVTGGQVMLVDLGSTNGTFVNGMSVASHVLADGDHVRFAQVSFRFRARPSYVLEPAAPDRRQTRVLEQLRRLSADVLATESERAAIRAATDFLVDQLGSDRVFVAFKRPGQDEPEIAMIRTRATLEKKHASAPVAHTPMIRVMKSGKTYCPTVPGDHEITSASMRASSLGSILVMPLVARGRILGAIQAERFDDFHGAYDEVDVLAGEIVANLVASTVETARLYRYAPREDARQASAGHSGALAGPRLG